MYWYNLLKYLYTYFKSSEINEINDISNKINNKRRKYFG